MLTIQKNIIKSLQLPTIKMRGNNLQSLDKKEITIQPTYLLSISGFVEILNEISEQEGVGSLTVPFKKHLQQTFSTLGQSLYLWENNQSLTHSAVLKAKVDVEMFCWEKLSFLLSRESKEIGKVIAELTSLSREHFEDYEKVLIQQRKNRLFENNAEKQTVIKKLKRELSIKSDHMKDLSTRLKQAEQQNSSLYSKLITNAKSTIQYSLSPPKNKSNSLGTGSFPKIKEPVNSHKTLTAKQVQEIIFQVMEKKAKHQAVKGRRISLDSFLTTYFRNKFGMRDLAEEAESSFREGLDYFAKNQEKNIYLLFISMLRQECNQSYFNESRSHYEKIAKCVKRYINAKSGTPVDELDKIYDSKIIDERNDIYLNERDINVVLSNIYGSQEVDSLQSIFAEILASRRDDSRDSSQLANHVPSKKIINEILNYQLRKYLFSIEDIVRIMIEVDTESKGYFNYAELENIAIRSGLSNQKVNLLASNSEELQGKFSTSSDVIEIILKLRKTKVKKRY